jgi:trehalose synthase
MSQEIEVPGRDAERFRGVLPPERYAELEHAAEQARTLLDGRVIWNVNSTARGGGVVELLRPLVGYARGLGVDARWLVIDGTPEFFELTKRIHNRLHGNEGDGGPLDERARRLYERVLADNLDAIRARVHAGDVVILHDPQPAGLVPHVHQAAAATIWRCHVGVDEANDLVRSAWAFLLPYLSEADAYVFHRESFVWNGLDRRRIVVIPPTIDVFTPKNEDLEPRVVHAVLRRAALIADGGDDPVTFMRPDGTPGRVERQVRSVEDERLHAETPLVVQVSRWDALKDPIGVIQGFAEHVPAATGAHLVYAGPDVESVDDDPEGARMLRQSIEVRASLPPDVRRRVHLVSLPMDDLDENALMVNALQRHAHVITQKSLAEGFGLTVSEGMWKARPVVASRVGGIQDQIVDGESGVLIDDPRDLASFGAAIVRLLEHPAQAEAIGRAARERVRDNFISARSLLDYFALIRRVLGVS